MPHHSAPLPSGWSPGPSWARCPWPRGRRPRRPAWRRATGSRRATTPPSSASPTTSRPSTQRASRASTRRSSSWTPSAHRRSRSDLRDLRLGLLAPRTPLVQDPPSEQARSRRTARRRRTASAGRPRRRLDVEWAHALAPKASILLVETPTDEVEGTTGFPDIVAAENYVIAHHLGHGDQPELRGDRGDLLLEGPAPVAALRLPRRGAGGRDGPRGAPATSAQRTTSTTRRRSTRGASRAGRRRTRSSPPSAGRGSTSTPRAARSPPPSPGTTPTSARSPRPTPRAAGTPCSSRALATRTR